LKKLGLNALTDLDTILIIGAGGLGLMATRLARSLCAARIVVAEIDPKKRRVALELGAHLAIDSANESEIADLREFVIARDGLGIAAAVDFVGLRQTMNFGLQMVRKGGQHVHVGMFGGAYSLSLPPVALRMQRIHGSYVGTLEEMRELVHLVRQGMTLPIPITARPLEAAESALADLQAGAVVGRIVLVP
jgi:D-arabinose 1-dehydrogenase-like Zn-dependent alcohol dehydrogenase